MEASKKGEAVAMHNAVQGQEPGRHPVGMAFCAKSHMVTQKLAY